MEIKEDEVKEEGAMVGLLEAEMRTRRKMKMWVPTEINRMRVSTTPVMKILEKK